MTQFIFLNSLDVLLAILLKIIKISKIKEELIKILIFRIYYII